MTTRYIWLLNNRVQMVRRRAMVRENSYKKIMIIIFFKHISDGQYSEVYIYEYLIK